MCYDIEIFYTQIMDLLFFLGSHKFLEQEEMTGEFVEEGRELIKQEKRRRERLK